MEKIFTVSEVAHRLGCCTETLRRYDNRGRFPARRRKYTNWRVYTEEDVQRLYALLNGEELDV